MNKKLPVIALGTDDGIYIATAEECNHPALLDQGNFYSPGTSTGVVYRIFEVEGGVQGVALPESWDSSYTPFISEVLGDQKEVYQEILEHYND